MPLKTSSKPPEPRRPALDDIDSYLLEGDFDVGEAFGSPSPDSGKNKRKEPSGLGIDEEVEIKRRATVPRVKLDEARLLSDKGIPELRRREKQLKLKGKGHEFGDAARLLSFYQLWLDDLFPKAKFLDALAMVEKAGHKTSMHRQRMEWINEGKPKTSVDDDEDFTERAPAQAEPTRIAPIFEKSTENAGRASTPNMDGVGADDDLYNATPRTKTAARNNGGEPDDDELDALIAQEEAEAQSSRQSNGTGSAPKPFKSIFGSGPDDDELEALMAQEEEESRDAGRSNGVGSAPKPTTRAFGGEPDEDELDALLAQEEEERARNQTQNKSVNSAPKSMTSGLGDEPDMDELDALMAQEEAEAPVRKDGEGPQAAGGSTSTVADGTPEGRSNPGDGDDDMDDLDALMAETESPPKPAAAEASTQEQSGAVTKDVAAEEEMAEMDGLWD